MASTAARNRASSPSPAGRLAPAAPTASIELYWLPLGAGGWFVRLNGRVWEAIHARVEHRRPLDLYHTALVVRLPEGRFVVENCWPIPDGDGPSRGVVVEGPVASRWMGRWRVLRYEVRRWRDGTIADADEAVASPQLLSDDPLQARRLLELVGCLPSPVWGRDQLGTGEMWNSNSVIAWLLAQSGLPTDAIRPPAGGRAPGWQAGLVMAHRSPSGIGNGLSSLRHHPRHLSAARPVQAGSAHVNTSPDHEADDAQTAAAAAGSPAPNLATIVPVIPGPSPHDKRHGPWSPTRDHSWR